MLKLVHGELALAPAVAQRLERDVQPDLVAELEAVGHGLGRVVDADRNSVNGVFFYPLSQGGSRVVDNAYGRAVDHGPAGVLMNGQPDLERALRTDLVETQSRKEADDPVRDPPCHHRQGIPRICLRIR